ncbi:hypothetical protein V6N13_142093 [Hibiscus sabdariffa]
MEILRRYSVDVGVEKTVSIVLVGEAGGHVVSGEGVGEQDVRVRQSQVAVKANVAWRGNIIWEGLNEVVSVSQLVMGVDHVQDNELVVTEANASNGPVFEGSTTEVLAYKGGAQVDFWRQLSKLMASLAIAVCCGGDFNVVKVMEELHNCIEDRIDMVAFGDFIKGMGLIDLLTSGLL